MPRTMRADAAAQGDGGQRALPFDPASIRLVLLDLDGTLYEGTRPVPGAAAAVAALRSAGRAVRFTTNTDSVTAATLVDRLAGLGVPATVDEIVTPVRLAARLFAGPPRARVLAVASPAVRAELGAHLAAPGETVTDVFVADPSYGAGYAALDAAMSALRAGARLVAAHLGRRVRRDDGEHMDTGGWVRLLEYAAETEALVLGKPSPEFFGLALDAAGVGPAEALVVGDDRASDVAGARAAGAWSVLVRTGKAGGSAGPDADAVVDSVASVPEMLAC